MCFFAVAIRAPSLENKRRKHFPALRAYIAIRVYLDSEELLEGAFLETTVSTSEPISHCRHPLERRE